MATHRRIILKLAEDFVDILFAGVHRLCKRLNDFVYLFAGLIPYSFVLLGKKLLSFVDVIFGKKRVWIMVPEYFCGNDKVRSFRSTTGVFEPSSWCSVIHFVATFPYFLKECDFVQSLSFKLKLEVPGKGRSDSGLRGLVHAFMHPYVFGCQRHTVAGLGKPGGGWLRRIFSRVHRQVLSEGDFNESILRLQREFLWMCSCDLSSGPWDFRRPPMPSPRNCE